MAKVRRATPADVDALVDLFALAHAEAPNYADEPYEPEVTHRWLTQRLAGATLLDDDFAIFVALAADGTLAGAMQAVVVPRWFNRRRIAGELVLYVRPERRGGRAFPRLVAAYEAWAAAQGASRAMVGVSTGIHPERTVHAYEHAGYTLDGTNLTKRL